MLHKMVQQLAGAHWGELDYLVLDLPPGTGDVQLTALQNLPLTGAVIVTTPQEIALIDARKGLAMFEQERLPFLGVVENMAYYRCRNCGKDHEIFPTSSKPLGQNVKRLGRLPIDPALANGGHDAGPLVLGDSSLGAALLDVAIETAAELGRRSLTPNPFRVLA
jgi:ATP-binding protein involved in chromosome partitioning